MDFDDFYSSRRRRSVGRRHSSRRDIDYYYNDDSLPAQHRSHARVPEPDDFSEPQFSKARRPREPRNPFNHRAVMRKGYLQYKKVVGFSKRLVVLIAPDSVEDILAMHIALFSEDPVSAGDNAKTISQLGQIACAAVKGCPLFVMYPPEDKPDTNIVFIPFTDVREVYGEDKLSTACNFSLVLTNRAEYRFATSSSTDYQEWFKQIDIAYQTVIQLNATRAKLGPPVLPNPLIDDPTAAKISFLESNSSDPTHMRAYSTGNESTHSLPNEKDKKPKLFKRVSTIVGAFFGSGAGSSTDGVSSVKSNGSAVANGSPLKYSVDDTAERKSQHSFQDNAIEKRFSQTHSVEYDSTHFVQSPATIEPTHTVYAYVAEDVVPPEGLQTTAENPNPSHNVETAMVYTDDAGNQQVEEQAVSGATPEQLKDSGEERPPPPPK